jgi:hypothetical protein
LALAGLLGAFECFKWTLPKLIEGLSDGSIKLYDVWKPLTILLSEATQFLDLSSVLDTKFDEMVCLNDNFTYDAVQKTCDGVSYSDYFLLKQNIGSKLGIMIAVSVFSRSKKIRFQTFFISILYIFSGNRLPFICTILLYPWLFVPNAASQTIGMILVRGAKIGSSTRADTVNILQLLRSTNKNVVYTWMFIVVTFVSSFFFSAVLLSPRLKKLKFWLK